MEIPLKLKYRTRKPTRGLKAVGDDQRRYHRRKLNDAAKALLPKQPFRVMVVNADRGSHRMITRAH